MRYLYIYAPDIPSSSSFLLPTEYSRIFGVLRSYLVRFFAFWRPYTATLNLVYKFQPKSLENLLQIMHTCFIRLLFPV